MDNIRKWSFLVLSLVILCYGILEIVSRDMVKDERFAYAEKDLDFQQEEQRNETTYSGTIDDKTKEESSNKPPPIPHLSSVYDQLLENVPFGHEEYLESLMNGSEGVHGKRKNVLFIMSDDLRPQLGSYWGDYFPNPFTHLKPHTPNLDRLASNSLLLRRAYVQYSLCAPSRASMLTGRRPDTVTTWGLRTKFREVQRNFTTMPQYFKENGYISINLGKIFHQAHGWKNDYDSWHIPGEGNPYIKEYLEQIAPNSRVAGPITPDQRAGSILTPDETNTRTAINYLRKLAPSAKAGKANFFLALGYHRPHLPWICSQEYFDLYPLENMDRPSEANKRYPKDYPMDSAFPHPELLHNLMNKTISTTELLPDNDAMYFRRAYYSCVSFVDDMVGVVLKELDKLGLTDSTIVTFLGDHGWHLGENNIWGKCSNFEQANHTPLMMKIPGQTDDGIVSDSLVEFVDIYPTLVEAADLPPVPPCPQQSRDIPVCVEGTSFLPLIKKPEASLKFAAISQMYYDAKMGYSIKTDKCRYTEWVPMVKREVEQGIYDYYLEWHNTTDIELYNHVNDIEENVNLAYDPAHKDLVEKNRKILRSLIPNAILHAKVKLFH